MKRIYLALSTLFSIIVISCSQSNPKSNEVENNLVQEEETLDKLNPKEYELLTTRHNAAVENYHVLLKRKEFDEDYIYQFIKQFRKEYCETKCNVSVYDSRIINDLIGVYPLSDKEYLKFADHLISISLFDSTELKDWYPYQDFRYKELGGKNWKKKAIE